ncbi:phosphatase PAP2 family protein [Pararhizobium sp. LjRoot255]|uniref:phosphatase PAP2 family protein n=1 Tax=Pararhizobium sp. LjRoot255 TaxID=3342298 RepID=UPI003ED080FB
MRVFFSAFGRTAFDYRFAYFILISHSALMSGLVWYFDAKPHFRTATTYLSWSFTALFNIAIFNMLWIVFRLFREGHEHPTAALKQKMAYLLLRNDRLAHATHSTLIFLALIVVFGSVKSTIPAITPFVWDETLIRLDRVIFAGVDPYVVTSAIFGNAYGITYLNFVYNLWLAIFIISMIWAPWIGNHTLRLRYMLTALLTWFVGGNVMALCFSSAGPCFIYLLNGDQTFVPLMDMLKGIDAETGTAWALFAQNVLWTSYSVEEGAISGISAMPSMHVAEAVVLACVAWQFGGIRRWLGVAFAATIFIGSIQLGWHYASDGILGGSLALMFWKSSAVLAAWSLDRPEMTAEAA